MQTAGRTYRWFPAVALLLWLDLALPPLVFPQATSGSVLGQIRISPGTMPSRPVLVTLKGRGTVVNVTYTDEEGHFYFNGLPGNIYHVVIEDDDYVPVNEQVVVDPDTAPSRMVNIYLVPRKPAKQEDSAVAGGDPNLTSEAEYGKLYPSNAVKQFKEGLKADRKQQIDLAILHYEKAVSLAPNFFAARNNLGTLYLGKADYEAAQKQFENVIAANPNDASAYFNLSNVHLLRHRYPEASASVAQGLSKRPNSAFGHFLLGSVNSRIGDGRRAETSLRRALELDPGMAQAHLALVDLYLQEQRSSDAISELKLFLMDFPTHNFAPKAREVLKRLETSAQAPPTN